MKEKEIFDLDHRTRDEDLSENNMILLHDIKRENNHTRKLEYKWLDPYLIHEVIPNKETYQFKELDETPFAETVAGNRLKSFKFKKTSQISFNINNNDNNTNKDSNNQKSTVKRKEDDLDNDLTNIDQQAFIPQG